MKYKTFTFINIFGLSLSISFCMMRYMYIRYEQSFDEFHVKKDRLFRLETTYLFDFSEKKPEKSFFGWLTRNDEVKNQLSFAMQLAPDIAILIAMPIAWWLMNNWLEDFAYRINFSGWILFFAGLAAVLIALIAVGFQAIKAAMANPVNSLRTD
jgi:hypothetical protein